ncbi:hypothetical protein C8F04DRAFT_1274290 [Mycena alexandri]|uniref:Uncharacterized protein n=1 Tax=Mycena alexandri TaxID=1745969 RepID=A0AAD6S502_9AGAR|nr:hypothetical protein C8F04DRAFT_1274290 [Mycena alexandri]
MSHGMRGSPFADLSTYQIGQTRFNDKKAAVAPSRFPLTLGPPENGDVAVVSAPTSQGVGTVSGWATECATWESTGQRAPISGCRLAARARSSYQTYEHACPVDAGDLAPGASARTGSPHRLHVKLARMECGPRVMADVPDSLRTQIEIAQQARSTSAERMGAESRTDRAFAHLAPRRGGTSTVHPAHFAPTAATLHEAPETLLRNRNPYGELSICDSKVAAVVAQGSYFITSPNTEDGLWGDDDPIQWPQIFTPTFCHFRDRMLWFRPTREHFICPASGRSILRGCGKLPPSVISGLHDIFEHVQKKYNAFLSSTPSEKIPALLPPLMQTAVHALSRLRMLPAGYMEMVFTIRALQRSLLEAIAIIDYRLVYQARMVAPKGTPVQMDPRMGAFTSDLRTVEDHLAAGLRVWFIQPSSAFRFQNILAITPLIFPQHILEMNFLEPTAPPVFVGGHVAKIECIQYLMRKIGYTSDPFNDPTTLASPMGAITGPTRNQGRLTVHKSAPYSKERKELHLTKSIRSSGRDKFKPVDSPYMPDYIPSWKNALASVNTHRPAHPRSANDSNYLFPDIAIFCTASSDDRKARYFTVWKHLRGALIHRVFSGALASDFPVVPLRPQDWRDVLNGDMFKQHAEPREPKKPTRNRTKILNLEKILAPCLADAGVSLHLENGPIEMSSWHWTDACTMCGCLGPNPENT